MQPDSARICPECGAERPLQVATGPCPSCLLGLGLAVGDAAPDDREWEPAIRSSTAEEQNQRGALPLGTPHPPEVEVLGDYELLEEVGRGGMGLVYKARQRSLDRVVALKLLLLGPHAPAELVKRFHAEAVATAALQHPNIVAIHEVGVYQGQHFLIMDFIDGPNLAKVISNRPLPASRAARYVKIIAEATHYAHEHGILHRDLKPSNVLIDANNQPRVTDFGLAKRLSESQPAASDSQLTLSGEVLGSPHYMPPEQATGKRGTVSRRSDVYALGAILYHALTGRPPFVGEGLAESVQQVLNSEPVLPRVLNPSVPADLETVCLKCLEKESAKRYATAQLLADELSLFLEGKPVLARSVGRLAKGWRWCRRNPRLAWALGVASFSMLLGLAGVAWQWHQAEAQRVRAEAGELVALRNAYAADMKELQRMLDESDLNRALELLNRYRPDASLDGQTSRARVDLRGWEWRYLWARCQSEESAPICRYSNGVSALAFSADGKWLAVRQEGGTVDLWHAAARRSATNIPGLGLAKALAFSPRGALLAWGAQNANGSADVNLLDMGAHSEITPLPHSHMVLSIAFSSDAKEMATLTFDGKVRIWDVYSRKVTADFPGAAHEAWPGRYSVVANAATPEPIWSSADDEYGRVLFSPDGRRVAVGEAKPRIRLIDRVASSESVIHLPPPADGITALAFSPDGTLLAAAYGFRDHGVHVWDLGAGTNMTFTGHKGSITDLSFSRDGQTLASVSTDQTLRLWDIAHQTDHRRLWGGKEALWAVAWSPDGRTLVTGARNGSLRSWDPARRPAEPYTVLPVKTRPWGLTFSPDSRTLLAVARSEGGIMAWNAVTLEKAENLAFLGSNYFSLDLSRDGHWLALCDTNGNIVVWDFPARQRVANLLFPKAWTFAVLFSPQSRYLHVGGFSPGRGFVGKMWQTITWREVNQEGINLHRLRDFALSRDEKTMAIGHDDGTVDWWDIGTHKRVGFFDWRYADMVRVRYSPDGRHFLMGGINDGRMLLWNLSTQEQRPIGHGYRSGLHDLIFTTDGRRVVTTGTSPRDIVRIWDVETGRDVATLPGELGLFFNRIGFSPDGNTLFANCIEGTSLLWRAPSWDEIDAKEKAAKVP